MDRELGGGRHVSKTRGEGEDRRLRVLDLHLVELPGSKISSAKDHQAKLARASSLSDEKIYQDRLEQYPWCAARNDTVA